MGLPVTQALARQFAGAVDVALLATSESGADSDEEVFGEVK